MKRIIYTIAALAAVVTGGAAAAVPAGAAVNPPQTFKLGSCVGETTADYGRGLSLVRGHSHQIQLSTKGNIAFTVHWKQTPATNGGLDWGTYSLSYKGRYLRVSSTHAWLGTVQQVYAEYAAYGDACGGPRLIHLGVIGDGTGDNPLSATVWGAHGKVLRAEPEAYQPPATPNDTQGPPVMRQVWQRG
jgi:hypothetical protein